MTVTADPTLADIPTHALWSEMAKRMRRLAEGLEPIDATAADLASRLSGRMIELADEGCLDDHR